jgi:glycosyltransferase involved in cell wall biosynthesis
MRVLLLLPYAWDTAPGQRFRIEQWCPWLSARGVEFHALTLLTHPQQRLLYSQGHPARKALMLAGCMARRVAQLRGLRGFDAIWLFRTALPLGPALLERVLAKTGIPLIFEFDDAIYLTQTSAANERWRLLKCSGKTARICRLSSHVVVGNDYLAQYARRFNSNVTVVPTTIDVDVYQPRDRYSASSPLVLGWSGSRSTVPHLRMLDRAIRRVASLANVRLHVIGTDSYALNGVDTYAAEWSSEREVWELNRFDIGLMPLPDEEWARGKCGLKALQYMAIGIPTVTSPVGVNAQIIRNGRNGLLATTEDEWVEALLTLVHDSRLREQLGRAGRQTVEEAFSSAVQAPRVLEVLQQVRKRGKTTLEDRAPLGA